MPAWSRTCRQQQASGGGGGGSIRSEARFSKFSLMLKMHIPMGAVAAKMRSTGCSPAEVTAFENDAALDGPRTTQVHDNKVGNVITCIFHLSYGARAQHRMLSKKITYLSKLREILYSYLRASFRCCFGLVLVCGSCRRKRHLGRAGA